MIKASEAHKKVDTIRKQRIRAEIRTAQDEILKYIALAQYSCTVDFIISDETKKMLEELEYQIEYQNGNTTIKW